jgi:hypothetical protein
MTEYSRHLPVNGFRLTGGDLTVGQGTGQTTQGHDGRGAVSVTARVVDLDVRLASWEGRGAAADSTLPLTTVPLPLVALPASVRVRIQAMPAPTCVEGDWRICLWFTDDAGRRLTWRCLARPGLDGTDHFSVPLAATLEGDHAY